MRVPSKRHTFKRARRGKPREGYAKGTPKKSEGTPRAWGHASTPGTQLTLGMRFSIFTEYLAEDLVARQRCYNKVRHSRVKRDYSFKKIERTLLCIRQKVNETVKSLKMDKTTGTGKIPMLFNYGVLLRGFSKCLYNCISYKCLFYRELEGTGWTTYRVG